MADRREEEPAVDGFAAARACLHERRAVAVPLYQALEPTTNADPRSLAALEAMVGEEALATIVTAPNEREPVLRAGSCAWRRRSASS